MATKCEIVRVDMSRHCEAAGRYSVVDQPGRELLICGRHLPMVIDRFGGRVSVSAPDTFVSAPVATRRIRMSDIKSINNVTLHGGSTLVWFKDETYACSGYGCDEGRDW